MASATLGKPASPLWQPQYAPAGCKFYLPLHEGAGPAARDLSGRGPAGILVGTPAWQRGPYGGQLGGFGNASFLDLGARPGVIGAWPCWWAARSVAAP